MKILHVSLGLPPFRSGGLTKYSLDLMLEQAKCNQVFLLYPGRFHFSKKTRIKQDKPYKRIAVYEIINPLPVPLLSGIEHPDLFMAQIDRAVYRTFLEELHPDIIHVHTLMGIHKELLEAAKTLKIKIVYTTHDYFGLCPKVNLMDDTNRLCTNFENGEKCVACNRGALRMPMIKVMQSKTYRLLKHSSIVTALRKCKKNQIKNDRTAITVKNETLPLPKKRTVTYVNLRDYYLSMFQLIDYFHFNSTTAKQQYEQYGAMQGKVIPISHGDIRDHRHETVHHVDDRKQLNIAYLGPIDAYKGFYFLHNQLKRLVNRGEGNWHLHVYGDYTNNPQLYPPEHYTFHDRYQYSELPNIFANIDVLVVPSIWKETFGFIGLEALSHGVPTLVSEYVGFQDVIEEGKTGFVFRLKGDDLTNQLQHLIENRDILTEMRANIVAMDFPYTMDRHTNEIISLYEQVMAGVEV